MTTTITLGTPGSDLQLGFPANIELIFARAGNDLIYGYDPVSSKTQTPNIDILAGDIFDSSPGEFTLLNQNILSIFRGNIPASASIWKDTFVLGDNNQAYYTDQGFLGILKFAIILDFDPNQDTIRLNGKPEDYRLVENFLGFPGEAIFRVKDGSRDLIAYVNKRPSENLNLTDTYFQYVNDTQENQPAQNEIKQFGTEGIDFSTGVATDPSGNFYLTGFTTGDLQGSNQGLFDAWIAKYDSDGYELWGKQIGTSANDRAFAIVTDNDGNFYVTGATQGDLFSTNQSEGNDAWVAKYNTNGDLLWSRQFAVTGAITTESNSINLNIDEGGNVYLSGTATKPNQRPDIFPLANQVDSWVSKFDSNGNQQWLTEYGNFAFDEAFDIAIDNNGNTYTTGWTQGLLEPADPSRTFLNYDAFLVKTDTNSDIQWIRQFGSNNDGLEFPWGVETDSKNNVYVTGWTTGSFETGAPNTNQPTIGSQSYDMWLAKYLPDGTQQWVQQFGTQGDDGTYLSGMEIDANDNIFLIGYTNAQLGEGSQDEAYNAWVAKFDTNGNEKWIRQFGSPERLDNPTDIIVGNDGHLYVTGITDGSLGSENAGAVDIWVAKLNANTGDLQEFNYDSKDNVRIAHANVTPTLDVSDDIITTANVAPTLDVSDDIITTANVAPTLDVSDDIITTANIIPTLNVSLVEGISTSSDFSDYGQLVSTLTGILESYAQNSFSTALSEETHNCTV
jgi:hypothetical protein